MSDVRRLATPRRARVRTDADGTPLSIDGQRVDVVRETWLIQDGWWTESPVRRRYWEVVTTAGANRVVFHDLIARDWWSQR